MGGNQSDQGLQFDEPFREPSWVRISHMLRTAVDATLKSRVFYSEAPALASTRRGLELELR
jgi:hypothetical protein